MRGFFSFLNNSDEWLFLKINKKFRFNFLDAVMSRLTHLGGAYFTLFICLVLIFSNFQASRFIALQAMMALIISQMFVQVLKKKVNRQRPYFTLENIIVTKPLFDNSFPSGHTAAGFALASSFAFNFPILGIPLFVLASLIGFSRTYLGFHYPLDVFTGAFLGTSTAYIVFLI